MLADLLKVQIDMANATAELAMAMLGANMLKHVAPRPGRKVPVITLPGLMMSEASLERLNRFLRQQGFHARGWGLGRNRGLRGVEWPDSLRRIRRHLTDQIKRLSDESSAAVSLVGHSMGGIYARELAQTMEGQIDRVITLGSPTLHPYKADRHNRFTMRVADVINQQRAAKLGGRKGLLHWDPDQPALPFVAIRSPVDGLVDEDSCAIPDYIVAQSRPESPRENIRVLSSHMGMTISPFVMLAVADRLVADRSDWHPFNPDAYFPMYMRRAAGMFYPQRRTLPEGRGLGPFVRMKQ